MPPCLHVKSGLTSERPSIPQTGTRPPRVIWRLWPHWDPLPGASLSLSSSLEFSGAGTQSLAEIGREQEEALLGGENLLHSDGFMPLFIFFCPFWVNWWREPFGFQLLSSIFLLPLAFLSTYKAWGKHDCKSCLQCGCRDPWVGKIPWKRACQPTPVFLSGESHRQSHLAGYGPWGRRGSDTTEWLSTAQNTGSLTISSSLIQTPSNAMDCSPPGFSVHGILQTRILEWVAISFSRGSSRPRDRNWVSCIAARPLPAELQRKPPADI